MYFIERIFGVTPDGGSGSLEFFMFAIPIGCLCCLVLKGWLQWRRTH